jgi:uncharacterized protein (TIGR02246 family)
MTDRQADEAAIETVLQALAKGFRDLDARALDGLYVEDADWTNAFGTTLKGASAIREYLARLFAEPNFAAGKPVGPPQGQVRFVTAHVAIAKTYIGREGQRTTDGRTLLRHNYSIKVLVRQPDGGWKIVSDLYMDARAEDTWAEGRHIASHLGGGYGLPAGSSA